MSCHRAMGSAREWTPEEPPQNQPLEARGRQAVMAGGSCSCAHIQPALQLVDALAGAGHVWDGGPAEAAVAKGHVAAAEQDEQYHPQAPHVARGRVGGLMRGAACQLGRQVRVGARQLGAGVAAARARRHVGRVRQQARGAQVAAALEAH